MNDFELGNFLETFTMALLLGVAWLGVCRIVPLLRDSPAASYGIAIALSWVPALSAVGGPTIFTVSTTLSCDALLCFATLYFLGNAGAHQARGGSGAEPIRH